MEHILVTGGAGFIGSNLVAALLNNPFNRVTILDNLDNFYSPTQKMRNINRFRLSRNFNFIHGDICRRADLNKITDVTTIVHLAAKAGVRPSILSPASYYSVNVEGTQNMLEYARRQGVKQFVFASSSSVYGINQKMPWSEEDQTGPVSPYAATKLAGESLGHVYSHLYGMRFLALRFFTVYGPGQRPDLAINKFFTNILLNKSIPVYGSGTSSRDYTFVADVVKGILAAINYNESLFEIINIGNTIPITLIELIRAVEKSCGIAAIIDKQPDQPGDVPFTMADITKARRLLKYKPSIVLEEGLGYFYKWLTDQPVTQAELTLSPNA